MFILSNREEDENWDDETLKLIGMLKKKGMIAGWRRVSRPAFMSLKTLLRNEEDFFIIGDERIDDYSEHND